MKTPSTGGQPISQLRGHDITSSNGGEWFYCDTGEPTAGHRRPCGLCGKKDTPEGHDGCLGVLPKVMNACCGHGNEGEAYVQFWDGTDRRGKSAILYFKKNTKQPFPSTTCGD